MKITVILSHTISKGVKQMTIIDYNKEIAIDVLEVSHRIVELEEDTVEMTDEVQFKVCTKEKPYYVECYYTGGEESDSYVIRVYDNEKGLGNSLLYGNHQIAVADVDSSGSIYDDGLQLEDKVVEQAIMDVLFAGDKPLIIPF